MIVTCTCGTKNRLPKDPTKRARCGKCKHVFTPKELLKAEHEKPPVAPDPLGELGKMLGLGGREYVGSVPPELRDPTAIGPDLDTMSDDELVDILMARGNDNGEESDPN